MKTTRVSLKDLQANVRKLQNYFDSLKKIYVGRDRIIELIKFAMVQKTHALFFGVPGTAKSAIADSLFAGITSSKKFEVQITAFMAEDALFGPYNMKTMREEGRLEHNIENMLPEANFANLDEFLDANSAVLRSMLSSLNERRLIKGRQVLDMPLHLAYCSTNIDPFIFMRRNPQAWAVFDRIGLIGDVNYLESPEEITEMVKRFQYRSSKTPDVSIDLAEINSICDYIIFPPTLVEDQIILMKYGEAIVEYRGERKKKMKELEEASLAQSHAGAVDIDFQGIIFQEISDRRICWASQMMEVNAVLNGRIKVIPEDMLACHFMLGTSEIETEIWQTIVQRKIEEIEELKKNQLSELQSQQLQSLNDQFDVLSTGGDDLETRTNGIATMITQLKNIKPENNTVHELYASLLGRVESYKERLKTEILNAKGLGERSTN